MRMQLLLLCSLFVSATYGAITTYTSLSGTFYDRYLSFFLFNSTVSLKIPHSILYSGGASGQYVNNAVEENVITW